MKFTNTYALSQKGLKINKGMFILPISFGFALTDGICTKIKNPALQLLVSSILTPIVGVVAGALTIVSSLIGGLITLGHVVVGFGKDVKEAIAKACSKKQPEEKVHTAPAL